MTFVVPRALVGTALRVVASRTNASGTASVASATVAVVASSPTAVSLSMGSSTVGAAVSTTVSADGGPAPTFAVTAGSLPAGLSLDSVTGVISGTPTTAGAYSFEITATNSAGSAAATFTGTVAGPVPESLSLTLGTLTTGTAVSATVTATGYPAPTFTVTAGALPAGLSLDLVTGVVSGTPTTPGSYSFEVTASNSAGSASATFTGTVAPAPNPSLGSFAPLPSSRVLDSRSTGAPIPAGSVQVVHVAGVAGVPNDASAAVLNITVDGGGEAGFVTTFPCGTPLPDTSNLNIAAGQTVANAVTVAMGTDGDVCVYSSVAVNLIVDISGVYSHNAGSALLTPLSPLRLLDTRLAGGNVAAGTVRELQVAGVAGVPVDAMAVVLNVTATRTLGDGFVTAFACGSAVPATSNVNFVAGATAANAVTTAIDSAGKVCFYSSAAIDLVVDVSDAFSPTGTAWLVPLAPVRLLDTRSSANPVAAGSVQEVQVAGLGGVPVGSVASVLNVTATGTAGVGYLTIFPCGSARPEASNLNFVIGQTVANAVTATLGTDGKVCIYTSADTHLVVDLNGAYGQPV